MPALVLALPLSLEKKASGVLSVWPVLLYPSHSAEEGPGNLLSLSVCRFWKRAGFVPVYLRQTPVSKASGRGRGEGQGGGRSVLAEPCDVCLLLFPGGCSRTSAEDSSEEHRSSGLPREALRTRI